MKNIQLCLLCYFLFVNHFSATAQTKNINNKNNNIHDSFFLSDSSSIDTETIAKKIADAYLSKQVIADFDYDLTVQKAQEIQEKLTKILTHYQGDLIGYKAGLTNEKAQETFNVNQPVLGTLLERMLLPSGIKVPSNFGARPMLEGDLMVRVASEKINEAKTPEETLKYLDAVIPFLELPDLVYDKSIKLNGQMLVAINVGARLGVVGNVIPLDASKVNKDYLNNISITLVDESEKIISQGNSNALLGNPLNVVFWLKEQLNSQGKTLQKGDLLSLGTITPLIPVKAGKTITAEYQGLQEDQIIEISVTFE
ncbi:MAG: hydratase [Crocosphaera sp.]